MQTCQPGTLYCNLISVIWPNGEKKELDISFSEDNYMLHLCENMTDKTLTCIPQQHMEFYLQFQYFEPQHY